MKLRQTNEFNKLNVGQPTVKVLNEDCQREIADSELN